MVKFLQGSKKIGLFRKEYMLSAVITPGTAPSAPDEELRLFREGFTSWTRRYGTSAKELLFVFMMGDERQDEIFAFFRSALGDPQVVEGLSKVQLRLQFPAMSQAVADQTHARILAHEL